MIGRVPNAYRTIGTHNPASLEALLTIDKIVASGTLTKKDQEAINLAVSEVSGCDYCLAAHTTIGKMVGLSPDEMKKIRHGEPSGDGKRDALVRFVRGLVTKHGTVSDEDFADISGAGYTEN
jgi:AhpD family alkylhydroperoxidase